jgi:hypothetical protein
MHTSTSNERLNFCAATHEHFHAIREALLPVVASGAFRFEQAFATRSADENQERTGRPAIDLSTLSVSVCKPHGALGVATVAIGPAIVACVIVFVP